MDTHIIILRKLCRRLNALTAIVLLCLLAAACDVHEFPTESERMPSNLHLRFDTRMTDWNVTTIATDTVTPTTRSTAPVVGTMRYVVRLYPIEADRQGADNMRHVAEYTFTRDCDGVCDADMYLEVAPGEYAIKVWADYLVDGKSYYNIDDFHEIKLQGTHTGNTDHRDAFHGMDTLVINSSIDEPVAVEKTIKMCRPMAKFEFVSSDLQEFLAKESQNIRRRAQQEGGGDAKGNIMPDVDLNEFSIEFYYDGYMPDTHNMFSNRPVDACMGVHFPGRIEKLSDDEVSLGFDYVFVGESQGSVMVHAVLFNKDGEVISLSDPVDVPLRRSVNTIVRGKFLTQSASGGMRINPDFSGDYNIVVP